MRAPHGVLFVILFFTVSAQAQTPPASAWLTEDMQRTEALADSTAASPKDWLTQFERSNYLETGRYPEALAFVQRLAKTSPMARLLTLGKTPQGRDLVVLLVSKDRAFTPAAAAKTGKPVIFIQNGIHAGEISGKDASLMLLRDVLITRKRQAWLDHVILAVMPVFNVDGHERFSPYHRVNQNGPKEMGFRATAQRLNLNRDYIKADAPEMRLWLSFYRQWLPDFLIDNHVTDGQDFQYDVTISSPTEQDIWPSTGEWAREIYLPELFEFMSKSRHSMALYGGFLDPRDPAKGFVPSTYTPRFSNGYASLHNRPSLLVETHSLKPHRTQAWAHYDIMRYTLDIVARRAGELRERVRSADSAVAALAGKGELFLDGEPDLTRPEPDIYKGLAVDMVRSPVTGGEYRVYRNEPANLNLPSFRRLKTTLAPKVPYAYAIPAEWTGLIDLLRLHGVEVMPLPQAVKVKTETYRLSEVKWGPQPFEGRLLLSFRTEAEAAARELPAGAVLVPMQQRAARVAFHILEPGAPDSALRWGFLNTIFEQKEYFSDYVFAPMAAAALERDPALRKEFEAKRAAEPKFAAEPREQLAWLYRRSPYFEGDKDVYPVLRVLEPLP